MYNNDTELIFPPRVIPTLRNLRGEAWQSLVDDVSATGEDSAQQLAFILLMARLTGCASCNADSFRALHGCTQCARKTLHRYRGSDQDLAEMYATAHADVVAYNQKKPLTGRQD